MGVSFRDIKADVLARMRRGDWPPGALLPGEEALAETYRCARTTVNRALRELAEEGYLDRKRKSGTRVRALPERRARFAIPITRREVEGQGAAYGYRLLTRRIAAVGAELRSRTGLGAGGEALHLTCLHLADATPFQVEDRWIDLTTLPQARDVDFAQRGPNEWLIETVPFSDVEISFSAIAASSGMADLLGCPAGAALFEVERATWLAGRPVTHVRLIYPPGHRMTTRY